MPTVAKSTDENWLSSFSRGASVASPLLGAAIGLRQGGVMGYGGAVFDIGKAVSASGAAGSATSALNNATGALGIGLSLYNLEQNWRSGATGSDALLAAETGAAIGSVIPGVGTLIGAALGGVVGGVSSIFGGGRADPENIGWDQYAGAYQQHGAAGVAGASPSQNFQMLAGIFDARGSQIPFYNAFGRMGENQFMQAMTTQINDALKAGTIAGNDSASSIYSKVVAPWINSMSPNGWQNTLTAKGAPEKAAIGNLLTSMIAQYQAGQQGQWTGISGQASPVTQRYGALGIAKNDAAVSTASTATQPFTNAVLSYPTGPSTGSLAAAMLPVLLGFAGGSTPGASMADPLNPASQVTGGTQAQADPSAGLTGGLSTLATDISQFFGSPLGQLAEFGTLAGIGQYQAGQAQRQIGSEAGSISALGQPFSVAGQGILGQLTGGPQVGGPVGASIATQTAAAGELGQVAKTYSTGNLTAAQQQQVQQYIQQQRAMVDTQLAASGNTDSSARQAAYQQIDNNAAQLTQQLTQGNVQIGTQALQSVQSTYSTLLNQAMSSSELGLGAQEAAVMTLVQGDTQLQQSLMQLFGLIAQGFGTAMGGGKGGQGTQPGGTGVSLSPSGGVAGGGGGAGYPAPLTGSALDTATAGQVASSQSAYQTQADITAQNAIDQQLSSINPSYIDTGATFTDPFGP